MLYGLMADDIERVRQAALKDPAQLDGWLRDGSAAHVEGLAEWE